MLTYHRLEQKPQPKSPEKPWLLVLLALVWLWTGIVGRDLWRSEEIQLYAYIKAILHNEHWLLPTLYHVPYLNSSPFYLWWGALSQWFLNGLLGISPRFAVQLLTLMVMSINFLLLGLAGRGFLGFRQGRVTVSIIIGCIGIVILGHQISPLPFLLLSLSIYSYVLSRYHKWPILAAGFTLGVAWALAFYIANFPIVFFLVILSLLLLAHQQWCNRHYILVLLVAFAFFLPLISLWIGAMRISYPLYLHLWFVTNSGFIYFLPSLPKLAAHAFYYVKNLSWYAFPAWILALIAIIKVKSLLYRDKNYFLFCCWIVFGFIYIIIQPDQQNNALLLIIPPLAFLGASQIDRLKHSATSFLNWLGIAMFGSAALFVWANYIAINSCLSSHIFARALYFNPIYQPHFSIIAITVALSFTPLWMYAVVRKHLQGRQAVTNWAAGVTFLWLLLCSLFLDWINTNRGYHALVQELENLMSPTIRTALHDKKICMDSNELEALAAWNEYSTLTVHPAIEPTSALFCRYHLSLSSNSDFSIQHPQALINYAPSRIRRKNRNFILWQTKNQVNHAD
mgnify:CR=1 FL=1